MDKKSAILIVDDEAIILMSLKQELRRKYGETFLLESALNATEANAIIEELSSEGVAVILIISDWLMPGTRGDDFLAEVKGRYPDVRCILISGHADPDSVSLTRSDLHVDAFIQKPWNRAEMLAAVDSCVRL
jgi:DNA-binding NtrC family response regulator